MKVIGLTGGIGTGKSTVSRFLSELGVVIIDADKVGHEALMPDCPICAEVTSAFGKEILNSEGNIDRKKLGKIVFDSPEALACLNRIVHPWMSGALKERLDNLRKQGVKAAVLEAALLIEAGWTSLVDEVWVTVAPRETVLKRLNGREGLPEEEAMSRISSQMPQTKRVKHADVVIDTDISLDALKARVTELWQKAL
jgi:dephospho-CoA kinase